MIIKLPQLAWFNPGELNLKLPDSWEVTVKNISGYNRQALSNDQIGSLIKNPIDGRPIRDRARGKKEVAVIFDDMTRITRIERIVPHVLAELAEAGIEEDNIRFVSALGSHGPMHRADFVKKLGAETVAKFRCYNHNAFDNCTYIGTTSQGTEVHINREVMRCDFKIAIGSITPHPRALFGGGGKIILPGVASIETILANHSLPLGTDYWSMPRNVEKEESVDLAGLDVLIECVFNLWGDSVAIYVGSEPQAHTAAYNDARSHYLADKENGADIVIANAFAKSNEAYIAMRASDSLSDKGGDIVIIANAPEGQISHYLMGRWGKNIWGKLHKNKPISPQIRNVIWYSEYPELSVVNDNLAPDRFHLMSNWDDVMRFLAEKHKDDAKVVVYPSADVQYFG